MSNEVKSDRGISGVGWNNIIQTAQLIVLIGAVAGAALKFGRAQERIYANTEAIARLQHSVGMLTEAVTSLAKLAAEGTTTDDYHNIELQRIFKRLNQLENREHDQPH